MLTNPTKVKHIIQLNDRHIKVYSSLKKYINVHGHPPSLRELALTTNISLSRIHKYLTDLEGLGYIERKSNRSRSIRIL